jgi:hypothetical protein
LVGRIEMDIKRIKNNEMLCENCKKKAVMMLVFFGEDEPCFYCEECGDCFELEFMQGVFYITSAPKKSKIIN